MFYQCSLTCHARRVPNMLGGASPRTRRPRAPQTFLTFY